MGKVSWWTFPMQSFRSYCADRQTHTHTHTESQTRIIATDATSVGISMWNVSLFIQSSGVATADEQLTNDNIIYIQTEYPFIKYIAVCVRVILCVNSWSTLIFLTCVSHTAHVIDIGWTVCLPVRHTLVLCRNGSTYRQTVFTACSGSPMI